MKTQRKLMIELWSTTNRSVPTAVAEYGIAEKTGKVARKQNVNSISSEKYALSLIRDGLKKGWLC